MSDDARSTRRSHQKAGKTELKRLLKNKLTWIAVGLLLIVLIAIPTTRYKLAGLLIKKSVTSVVIDQDLYTGQQRRC